MGRQVSSLDSWPKKLRKLRKLSFSMKTTKSYKDAALSPEDIAFATFEGNYMQYEGSVLIGSSKR